MNYCIFTVAMKKTVLILTIAAIGGLASCSRSGSSDEQKTMDSLTSLPDTLSGEKKELVEFKLFYTLANLPSPLELINSIYQCQLPFNSDLLNAAANESKYTSAFKKAVNYGIYGADMAYAAFYGENQDLINSYMVAKKMAGRLNISETFDRFTAEFQNNQSNKDSMITIIDRAYSETDSYLRNNNRAMAAAQTLAGAILEVQYITLEVMQKETPNEKNKVVFENIYKQKLYLDNLIGLFEELKADKDCAQLLNSLKEQKTTFDAISTVNDLTTENLGKLTAAVGKTRNGLVK